MLKKMISLSLMTLVLVFGGLQLTVQRVEAANPACLACCPPTMGGKWLYDCIGPWSLPEGDVVGCAYTSGAYSEPYNLWVCGWEQQ